MATVTVEQLYKCLRAHGASEIGAAGITGNSVSEVGPSTSDLSPDSELRTDYNEPGCIGLWCWEPEFFNPPRPTGNAIVDMNDQVAYLKENGGFEKAVGTTAEEAGRNFALNYERCEFCGSGQQQWIARGNQAAAVAELAKRYGWDEPAKSMHYDWFVKRELTAVKRYDYWRDRKEKYKLTKQHAAWYQMRRLQCKTLAGALAVIAKAHGGYGEFHRGWREQQLLHRGQGELIKPS